MRKFFIMGLVLSISISISHARGGDTIQLDDNRFRIDSNLSVNQKIKNGWKIKKFPSTSSWNTISVIINPQNDIMEIVSGADGQFIGQQYFTQTAALREVKKAGKELPNYKDIIIWLKNNYISGDTDTTFREKIDIGNGYFSYKDQGIHGIGQGAIRYILNDGSYVFFNGLLKDGLNSDFLSFAQKNYDYNNSDMMTVRCIKSRKIEPIFSGNIQKTLTLDMNYLKIESGLSIPDKIKKGWKIRNITQFRKGKYPVKILENPLGDVWEFVSGVSPDLIGEQFFMKTAADRELAKTGKRLATQSEIRALITDYKNVFGKDRFAKFITYEGIKFGGFFKIEDTFTPGYLDIEDAIREAKLLGKTMPAYYKDMDTLINTYKNKYKLKTNTEAIDKILLKEKTLNIFLKDHFHGIPIGDGEKPMFLIKKGIFHQFSTGLDSMVNFFNGGGGSKEGHMVRYVK